MAVKNANVTARVEQDVKDQAEKILYQYGLPTGYSAQGNPVFYYNTFRTQDS